MRAFSCLIATAVVLGAGAAVRTHSASEAAYRYSVDMYPPSGDNGQYAHLHCKYHGACGASAGYGLDWDNWTNRTDRRVRWRSYLYNNTGLSLEFIVSPNYQDSYHCDYFKAWLYDQGLGYGRGDMLYVHSTTTRAGTTYYPANGWSAAYYIGDMANDTDCAGDGWSWSGFHIHEKDAGSWVNSRNTSKYSGGTYGDYCSPSPTHGSDNCLKVHNQDSAYWTRRFQW